MNSNPPSSTTAAWPPFRQPPHPAGEVAVAPVARRGRGPGGRRGGVSAPEVVAPEGVSMAPGASVTGAATQAGAHAAARGAETAARGADTAAGGDALAAAMAVAGMRPRSRAQLRMELAAEALLELDPDSEISCAFQEFLGEEAMPMLLAAMHGGTAVAEASVQGWMLEQAEAWLRRESRLAQAHWAQCAF